MMNVITSLSEEAVRSLIEEMKTIKISEEPGENVAKIVSKLRGGISRLRNLNKLPQDVLKQLIRIFQTSSVPNFNGLFKTVESNMRMGYANVDIESILQLAEDTYTELVSCKEWHSSSGSDSLFVARGGQKKGDNKPITCWNCGQQGHKSNACPHPRKPQQQNQPPRGGGAPNPVGANNQGLEQDWHTIPPPDRAPHQKEVNGKIFYWCAKCNRGAGRWNLTHKTAKHQAGIGKRNNQGDGPQANNAAAPPSSDNNNSDNNRLSGQRVSFSESVRSAVGILRNS